MFTAEIFIIATRRHKFIIIPGERIKFKLQNMKNKFKICKLNYIKKFIYIRKKQLIIYYTRQNEKNEVQLYLDILISQHY